MQNTKTELMKIYYDSCQSMVALRKTTQAFDAAYNKPRLSTRSAQAEAPAGRPRLLGEDESFTPTSPSALWPPPALE